MDHSFFSDSRDQTRHTCIWKRTAFFYDPSQIVAPHGFDHIIHIFSCGKPRSKTYCHWCHISVCPEIFFGEDRIDHCCRRKFPDMFSLRICQKGNFSFFPAAFALCRNFRFRDPSAHNAFHFRSSVINGFTESYMTADGAWPVAFQDQNVIAALMKFMDHAGSKIAAATYKDHSVSHNSSFHFHTPAVRYFPASLLPEHRKVPHRSHPDMEIHRTDLPVQR